MAPKEMVFYVPAHAGVVPQVIDTVVVRNGQNTSFYKGETLEQVRTRYPGAQLGDFDEVVEIKETMLCSEPQEITEEKFYDGLEMLPPEDYVSAGGVSFKCCERLSGRVTAVYAAVGGRYFVFNDLYTISHASIMSKVRASDAFKAQPAAIPA